MYVLKIDIKNKFSGLSSLGKVRHKNKACEKWPVNIRVSQTMMMA